MPSQVFRISNKVYTAKAYPTQLLPTRQFKTRRSSYTPPTQRFRAAIFRGSKGTVLIYPNGSAVITKVKTRASLGRTRAECFLTLGVGLSGFRLVNIVGYARLNKRLDLPGLFLTIPKAIYISDEHCGLLFYIDKVSVIAYHTGVLMFCGCKSYAEYKYVVYKLTRMFINSHVRSTRHTASIVS